ncbi:hypothetical protein JTB14_033430 [Gonioctena quinquepunctata]|nr:hypothetical protein JTB14_033430 [Gonioctena quinquepunctata]
MKPEDIMKCHPNRSSYETDPRMAMLKSNTIINAIYMSEWYTYDRKSKKALLILMERAKRPMIVTAGKILDLSLGTFMMIIKRSYSLLAVLKNY